MVLTTASSWATLAIVIGLAAAVVVLIAGSNQRWGR